MIGSISGSSAGQALSSSKSDPVADSIRRQITALEKQKGEIEQNDKLTLEQKNEKKKELEAQIAALNQQLRQHEVQKREQEAKAQAEAIKERSERYEQEKPPEEQAQDVQRELSYGFALSESHLYAAKGAQSAYVAAKGQSALAEVQAKSYNGSGASPEAAAGSNSAMERALQYRGESFRKAAGAMERMGERLGDLYSDANKAEREEEAAAVRSPEENGENGAVPGAQEEQGVQETGALPGANRAAESDAAPGTREENRAERDDEERRKKHIDILL